MTQADTQTDLLPATPETEERGGCSRAAFCSAIDAEYHSSLSLRLDDCVRRGKQPETEDLCGASAAALALALNSLRASDDQSRLDWLDAECRAGRVILSINHTPRGAGNTVRAAIDDAIKHELPN